MAGNGVVLGYIPIVASDLVSCKMDVQELSKHIQRLLQQAVEAIPATGSLANVASPTCMPVAKTQDPDRQLWLISISLSYYDASAPRANRPATSNDQALPAQVEQFVDLAAATGARVNVEPVSDRSAVERGVAASKRPGPGELLGPAALGSNKLFGGQSLFDLAKQYPGRIDRGNATLDAQSDKNLLEAVGRQGEATLAPRADQPADASNRRAGHGFPDPREL